MPHARPYTFSSGRKIASAIEKICDRESLGSDPTLFEMVPADSLMAVDAEKTMGDAFGKSKDRDKVL